MTKGGCFRKLIGEGYSEKEAKAIVASRESKKEEKRQKKKK